MKITWADIVVWLVASVIGQWLGFYLALDYFKGEHPVLLHDANYSLAQTQRFGQYTACGPRKQILQNLERQYHEVPKWHGATSVGTLAEITLSSRDSWTILVTINPATSCFILSGDGWGSSIDLPTGRDL